MFRKGYIHKQTLLFILFIYIIIKGIRKKPPFYKTLI